jgi:hypothetical protein
MQIQRPEVDVIVKIHAAKCPLKKDTTKPKKLCRCPKYLYIPRDRNRISAKTRSWDHAADAAKAYADARDPVLIEQRRREQEKQNQETLLSVAVANFLTARNAIGVSKKTNDNLRPDCNQLVDFITERNRNKPESAKILYVSQVTTELLDEWMGTWKGRPKLDSKGRPTTDCTLYTKMKKRKHINALFKYCLDRKYITDNPAAKMMKISRRNQPSPIPKLPFERHQMEVILKAASQENHCQRAHLIQFVGLFRSFDFCGGGIFRQKFLVAVVWEFPLKRGHALPRWRRRSHPACEYLRDLCWFLRNYISPHPFSSDSFLTQQVTEWGERRRRSEFVKSLRMPSTVFAGCLIFFGN